MNNEQLERFIKAIYRVEESVQKTRAKLSWMPFWIAGYLFTIGLNWQECLEVLDTSTWYNCWLYLVIWFIGWPMFLGYTLGR